MSIEITGDMIRIVGNAPVADAEPVLAALIENPSRVVDLASAAHLHSAIVQILLAVKPRIIGTPSQHFFTTYVLPQLDPGEGTA